MMVTVSGGGQVMGLQWFPDGEGAQRSQRWGEKGASDCTCPL